MGGTRSPREWTTRDPAKPAKTHSVFRAVKAQHSENRRECRSSRTGLPTLASSTGFFFFHVLAFAAWLIWNFGFFGLPQFDPFPYGLLTMIVSLEAIFLSIFVLMSQSQRIEDRRAS